MSPRITAVVALCVVAGQALGQAENEPIGSRPYEMVWAQRTEDTRPPLVDFENLDGWTVETADAVAAWSATGRQPLWGERVGQLTYRAAGGQPRVSVKPPRAIALPPGFDCFNLWLYGNNWAWVPDRTTPQVEIVLVLRGRQGQPVRISLGRVRWKEWWLMHRRLSRDEIEALGDSASVEAIEVLGGRNTDDRTLYFDNLAAYREELPPLEFEPRPARNLTLFPGQTAGTNTGPGRLPFPTREETILPDNLAKDYRVRLEQPGESYRFHYAGDDGHLVYEYRPSSGTLGDVTAHWEGRGEPFRPLDGGGVAFWIDERGKSVPPDKIEPLECRREGETVISRWRCALGERRIDVEYRLRLWQKSLIIDCLCPGGEVGEFRTGRAVGALNPRLVTLPYLTGDAQRPAVLVAGPADQPLFTFALIDYYRSNASSLWAVNRIAGDGVEHNGGARYLPKTDGRRNDCFERLFLTVSPRFEEILPNVPNPKSPWMHVTGSRVWRAHGASNRESDYALWKRVARHGMSQIVITDHEVGWRDGGESFTFRTRAAPGKGGDEGQADYARKIRGLGFRYGIYNNYTDFAPVNEYWHEDMVTRLPDGEWQTAWPRCYNPKPARAVEYESKLAPIIQQKFHLDTAYCDVHTAVRPWQYCDYDARVPGAGTFAATLYSYGEIMLHQKQTWNGPVYSEGNNHWYYCGLTDGNYGQDQAARLDEQPWLVDFDLRKLHPLCCNFGMGNLGMFFGRDEGFGATPAEREARLDRFLAATLAFGHTGFLVMEGGMENAVRSYYSVQQIHAHYADQTAAEIRYADESGRLLDTSAAVATGAYQRSQVATRYSNGLEVVVNGHPSETWQTADAILPPNGWFVRGDLSDGKLLAFSALVDGHRADYVDSPAYIYANGRGRLTRFEKALCDGQLAANRRGDGSVELIPVGKCSTLAVALDGQSAAAVAHDESGGEIGIAQTRFSRGLVHVTPVEGAFSYILKPVAPPAVSLRSPRMAVVPGETVTVTGREEHAFRIPPEATPGEPLWQSFEDAWIDFDVHPLVGAELVVDGSLRLHLTPHVAAPTQATVTLAGEARTVELAPESPLALEWPWKRPTGEEVQPVEVTVTAGSLHYRRTWWLKSEEAVLKLGEFPAEFTAGQRLRGEGEKSLDDVTRAVADWRESSCGGQSRKCLFMHPPYMHGVGYTFALSPAIRLPADPPAVLACEIGKADGSDSGDGIVFRIAVVDSTGRETLLAEKSWIAHAWTPLEADLTPWAGQEVRLKLIADVGPNDNSSGDWACWSPIELRSRGLTLVTTVHDEVVVLERVPGPHPQPDLTIADLRGARSGVLHFQAIGLQSSGQYISHGKLNGVALGPIPAGGGNEASGEWADVEIPLSAAALAALAEWNTFSIDNRGGDSFAVRGAWIEIELADGRKASSQITRTAFTQPPGWPHGAGIAVPAGEPIEFRLRFATLK